MAASGTVIDGGSGAAITVTGGGVVVDSTSAGNIDFRSNTSLTAPSVVIAGGSVSLGSGSTITPNPVVGVAQADPFPSLVAPSVAGPPVAYTAPAGAAAISPGFYSGITVPGGATLTLNPGTYVLTGDFSITGGTVNGSGVILYLACSGYPTACLSGADGAAINMTSGSLSLSPPTTGTYAGLTVFADRGNAAPSTLAKITSLSVSGTWYGLQTAIVLSHPSDQAAFGQLVVASLSVAKNQDVTVSRTAPVYGSGASGVRLSL
jgi:hypothetical protein